MIKVNCETKDKLKLVDMIPFQGNLKKRTEQDIEELTNSLVTEGLIMPFAIWKHDDKNYLLDGHGRRQALLALAGDARYPEVFETEWPVIFIEAETEDDARKALLQITSQYGKITKAGVKQFTVSIPDYKAPSIKKFVAKPVKVKNANDVKPVVSDKVVLKIRIDRDKFDYVKQILSEFNFIEVL